MLTWTKMESATGYIGFDDGCPCYFVKHDEDGWYWEDSWGFGKGDFETAEEAKASAEEDAPAPLYDEPLSLEDLEDIHWDEVAHERMEIAKGLW
jgi:hypothetical protein